ncbi:unnamed protein product [Mytilus coruscus]|uniref:Reverse transcriptase RNase H-like domain-containing protein n=1 Tax=Mytilus coruscus TaxID=42192 RepID=A0A6J8A7G8_MYTCO|nr:unnamed protein product [Mytilus coruscus]
MVKNDVLAVVSSAVIDTDSDQVDVYEEIHEIPCTDSGENAEHIDGNPYLDESQILQLKELLFSFPEVFTDSPGCTDLLEHDIQLFSETLIRMKPYPIPYRMLDTLNIGVSKMLDLGVIVASTSPYASPIDIVRLRKKDNTNRFCIDFRSLNSQTLFDAAPMKCEVAYSTLDKECIVFGVWAIQKFQKDLYGREFILETDHQPLTYLNKKKVENARLMKLVLALQPYRFRILAVKGKDNIDADYLSRV